MTCRPFLRISFASSETCQSKTKRASRRPWRVWKPEVPGDPRSRLDAASEPPAPPQSPPPSLVPLSPLPTPPPPLSSLPPMRLAAARWPSITAGRWTPPLSSPLVPVPLSLVLYWLPNPRCHHRLPSAAAPQVGDGAALIHSNAPPARPLTSARSVVACADSTFAMWIVQNTSW